MDENIIKALNWRYATKVFNTTKKLSSDQVNLLLDVTRLAPASTGLQPWTFIVVNNKEIREQLKAAAYGQPQITDASHLIVFTRTLDIQKRADLQIEETMKVRSVNKDDLAGYKGMLDGVVAMNKFDNYKSWSERQTYIAFGFMIESAALMGIDACPMEGFDNRKFDEILGLEKAGLTSVGVIALGYRSDEDKYAHAKKVRLPKEEVVKIID